jgi:hypothetical protein
VKAITKFLALSLPFREKFMTIAWRSRIGAAQALAALDQESAKAKEG